MFTIKVAIEGGGTPGENVSIIIPGIGTELTDLSGEADFTAPEVESDTNFTITAEKEGYLTDTGYINVINKPQLSIQAPETVLEEELFTVTIINEEDGTPIEGVTVEFIGVETKTTNGSGEVNFTTPLVESDTTFTITAEKEGYKNANPVEILVKKPDNVAPIVEIANPESALYIFDNKIWDYLLPRIPLIIGKITIKVNATDSKSGIDYVEFYIDDELKESLSSEPYSWVWEELSFKGFKETSTIKIVVYDLAGNSASEEMVVRKIL
jgi:hypothetical protein